MDAGVQAFRYGRTQWDSLLIQRVEKRRETALEADSLTVNCLEIRMATRFEILRLRERIPNLARRKAVAENTTKAANGVRMESL